MFLLVQLMQNPFICNYFQGKKKAITAVSKKLPWILLVILFTTTPKSAACQERVTLGCWMSGVDRRSSSWERWPALTGFFITSAAFYECRWNTLWQFLAESFTCWWTRGFSQHLNLIISGWSCRGERASLGSALWEGACGFSSIGKGNNWLIALFTIL